jgi:hypothetical protein
MAIQNFVHHCACGMLGVEELPLDLRNYLDDCEMYTNYVEGTIASRQIVAMALIHFQTTKGLNARIERLEEINGN